MQSYLEKINQYISGLDKETIAALEQISDIKTYKKGDLLLKQNEVSSKSYHILSGIARKFFIHNDKEITTELYFEQDLAFSFESYTLQTPSKEYIEALTDVKVSVIHYHAFQDAKQKFPKLTTLDLMLVEYYSIWLENRLFQFHTQSATEKYLDIVTKSPHLIQQLPLTIIASYLNISLETLSRIRAKIS
ncbi:MAG: Crp/Fnr family transcriptional regulator [Bacteroidia bacterium]|jgi:CRP-like cAMP-binding protein|nr:Crp/Fnr family transcriptional regulator [Bacteroidia bacterium]